MPMRQLRSCDFCGGDAAGVYEVLPPELSPTEAEQQRLVLCSDCAETLETVVDPLLDRLGVGTADDASTADAGAPPSDAGAGADPPPSGTASAAEAPPPSESATSDPDTADSGEAATDGTVQWDEVEPTTSASGAADSDGNGRDEDVPGEAIDSERAADADESRGVPNSHTDDPDGHTDDPDGSGGAAASRPDEPEEFRTVMRLLGNREFPVERGAIVELATNAYELDEQHVHRIIDHAVDRGVIADDGGTLRRG